MNLIEIVDSIWKSSLSDASLESSNPMAPRHGTTFAREGSLIMAPREHAQFVAQELAGFCMYAWMQMLPQASSPQVDADILRAFSVNIDGDRVHCQPSPLGLGWYGDNNQKDLRDIEQSRWIRHCNRMASRIPSMVCHGHAPFDAMDDSLYVEESDYNYAKGKTTDYNIWKDNWIEEDCVMTDGEAFAPGTDAGKHADDITQQPADAISNDTGKNRLSYDGGKSNKGKKRKANKTTYSGGFHGFIFIIVF